MLKQLWQVAVYVLAFCGALAVLSLLIKSRDELLFTLSTVYGVESTQQAPFFSPTSFPRITVGMSEEEVISMLGPPLWASTKCDGTTKAVSLEKSTCKLDTTTLTCSTPSDIRLQYSFLGDSDLNFWNRSVVISNGKVVEVFEHYELERPPFPGTFPH